LKRYNVPPKRIRDFHHLVVRPNPALPPVCPLALSPAAGGVYHTRNGIALTDEEWEWHVKCGFSVPSLKYYFTTDINPKTGTAFLKSAQDGLKVIGLAASTSTSELIKSHVVTKRSGQFYTYDRYNLIAVIAIVCTRAFLGYHRSAGNMGNGYTMEQYMVKQLDNDIEYQFFMDTVMKLVDYVFKWVINNDHQVKRADVLKCFVEQVEDRIRCRTKRNKYSMFSNRYIAENVGSLSNKTHPVVQGHLYEWAVVFDMCIPQFRNQLIKTKHYVTQYEADHLFEDNLEKRLFKPL
jgi:protein associated with RNAse G/E